MEGVARLSFLLLAGGSVLSEEFVNLVEVSTSFW